MEAVHLLPGFPDVMEAAECERVAGDELVVRLRRREDKPDQRNREEHREAEQDQRAQRQRGAVPDAEAAWEIPPPVPALEGRESATSPFSHPVVSRRRDHAAVGAPRPGVPLSLCWFRCPSCKDPTFMPVSAHDRRILARRRAKHRVVAGMSRLPRIVGFEARDIRFPTSRWLDGSDAMHTDPDYSAAYVVLRTDADDGVEGHGLTFTSGRGTEVCVAAAHALEPFVVGRTLDGIIGDMSGFWRSLVSDSQLRWIGPEKGAIHLATAAVVNAVWDLWAKIEGKPSVEAARRPHTGGDRGLHRLPLHHGRARTGGGARAPARRATRQCG